MFSKPGKQKKYFGGGRPSCFRASQKHILKHRTKRPMEHQNKAWAKSTKPRLESQQKMHCSCLIEKE